MHYPICPQLSLKISGKIPQALRRRQITYGQTDHGNFAPSVTHALYTYYVSSNFSYIFILYSFSIFKYKVSKDEKTCDADLEGLSYLQTCSAFVLMLGGATVAVMTVIPERVIGWEKLVKSCEQSIHSGNDYETLVFTTTRC